ncbi:hypothetical protein CAPTEDRAFT_142623 [Capitella teleta]|uniref:Sulfotransferase domain-containing protein n=1 Tax=Capitella teleta TaxID=283909 RepID=R7VHP0_CAPTE|nr:hypothetical protein CAPTEDRAFT_142623 [Capitella teleta]|eukprot:ELU15816.1 hypothetical protein CAPTEDRAFT_142623 [Capitella teleta]
MSEELNGSDPSELVDEWFKERKFAELKAIPEDIEGRKPRLPQCILIGERKTGTTALLHFLVRHPQIKAPRKEIHFFDQNANFREGQLWYVNKMPTTNSTEVTFEKTPSYFRSSWTPERMHKMIPDVKLMLSLRDPIQRAISDFHFSIEANWSCDFDKTLHSSFDGYALNDGKINMDFPPIARSIYALSLENWFKYFDRKQFFIYDGDSFVHENPAKLLQKIEKFIGLEPYFTLKMFSYSKTRGFWCLKDPGCISFGGRPHADLEAVTRQKIKRFFHPYNQKLYDMVSHDFGWS